MQMFDFYQLCVWPLYEDGLVLLLLRHKKAPVLGLTTHTDMEAFKESTAL